MMKYNFAKLTIRIIFAALALLAAASCSKNSEESKSERQQPKAVKKVKLSDQEKALKNAGQAKEKAEARIEETPKENKNFISISLPESGARAGEAFECSVEIAAPFSNPFNSSDISVEAYVSSDSASFSENIAMFYMGGDSKKSKWKFIVIPPKAGNYKCSFNVRSKDASFSSMEYPFNVAAGAKPSLYKIRKNNFSHFSSSKDDNFRGIGANFNINIDPAARDAIFKGMQAAGANVARLSIEAPLTLILPSDSGILKAGSVNIAIVDKIEDFMDSAKKHGINTIISFSSQLSFNKDMWKNSYFAKSGVAPEPDDFFTSQKAQRLYDRAVEYLASRIGRRSDLLAWEPSSGIDSVNTENFDPRINWLSAFASNLRNLMHESRHPILLTAGSSSEFDFIWNTDACDILAFEIENSRDFAESVNAHSDFFSKLYRKAVSISKISNTAKWNSDPSNIYVHNAIWSGLMTPSPLLPLADFTKSASIKSSMDVLKRVSDFEKRFNTASKNLESLNLQNMVVGVSKKALENFTEFQPAFGETHPSRESSSDIAEVRILPNGTILKNTMPEVWKSGSTITIKLDDIPSDTCVLSFEISDATAPALLEISRDSEPIMKKDIAAPAKASKAAKASETVDIALRKGDQALTFRLIPNDGAKASIRANNFKLAGTGSNRGVASVKVYGVKDKKSSATYLWFKRAATDTYTYNKYKLYNRDIPILKSFEYTLNLGNEYAMRNFKIVWWDTRNSKEIATIDAKSNAHGKLSIQVPQFKFDIACAIEESN